MSWSQATEACVVLAIMWWQPLVVGRLQCDSHVDCIGVKHCLGPFGYLARPGQTSSSSCQHALPYMPDPTSCIRRLESARLRLGLVPSRGIRTSTAKYLQLTD